MTRTHFSTDKCLGFEAGAYVNSRDLAAIARRLERKLGGRAGGFHYAGRSGNTAHYTVTLARRGEIVASGTVYVQR